MNIINIIRYIVHWALVTIKAFFYATTQIIWGFTGIFLLAYMIITLKVNPTSIQAIITLGSYMMKYGLWFWIVAFLYELWTAPEMPKLLKTKEKTKEERGGNNGMH